MKKEKPFSIKNFAIATLRRSSYRLRARTDALKEAKTARNCYTCCKCKNTFGRKDIQMDHKIPVVPLNGWVSFDSFIERLYVEKDGFQVMCRICHKEKTKGEAAIRKFHRDAALEKKISGNDDK